MEKLLIVVDYQKDFVSGSLGFQEAIALEEHIYQTILEFQNANQDILYTFDSHDENYMQSQEGKYLPIPHCLKNSEGWKLSGKIDSLLRDQDTRIYKHTFGSLELGNYLRDNPYDEITFVGVVSNICVISNAIIAKAALPEATIIIDEQGIASNDIQLHQKAMDVMKGLQMQIKNKGTN